MQMTDIKKIRAFLKAYEVLRGKVEDVRDVLTMAEMRIVTDYVMGKKAAPVQPTMAGTYRVGRSIDWEKVPANLRDPWAPSGYMPVAERKIDCIKIFRKVTSCGLKEAKDFIEGSEVYLTEAQACEMSAFMDLVRV
jgi:hypothetical protein